MPFRKTQKNVDLDQQIDYSRCSQFKIYNIVEELKTCAFTRNSSFPYSMVKDKKVYKPKWAELKVEKYTSFTQSSKESKRIGHIKINLA